VYEDYVHDMRSEMFLAERFEHLDKTEDILLKAIHWIVCVRAKPWLTTRVEVSGFVKPRRSG